MKIEHTERRRESRVSAAGQVSLGVKNAVSSAVLKNISLAGLLCQALQEVPEMTLVDLRLELPRLAEEHESTSYRVDCRGVVVRCEPVTRGNSRRRFDIAIYFTDLPDASRTALERFIKVRKE